MLSLMTSLLHEIGLNKLKNGYIYVIKKSPDHALGEKGQYNSTWFNQMLCVDGNILAILYYIFHHYVICLFHCVKV